MSQINNETIETRAAAFRDMYKDEAANPDVYPWSDYTSIEAVRFHVHCALTLAQQNGEYILPSDTTGEVHVYHLEDDVFTHVRSIRFARYLCRTGVTYVPALDFAPSNKIENVASAMLRPYQTKVVDVTGYNIIDVYRHACLGSCMTADSAECTTLYAQNPEKISLGVVVPTSTDESDPEAIGATMLARAIVFKTIHGNFVGRIYCNSSKDVFEQQLKEFFQHTEARTKIIRLETDLEDGTIPYMDNYNQIAPSSHAGCYLFYDKQTNKQTHKATSTDGCVQKKCKNCGFYVSVARLDDDGHCEDCCGEYCDDCGGIMREQFIVYNENGYQISVCERCFEDYCFCAECEEHHHADDSHEVRGGEIVCNQCLDRLFVQCKDCEEYILRTSSCDLPDGTYICEACADENYQECQGCHELTPIADIDDNDGYCIACSELRFRCWKCESSFADEDIIHVFEKTYCKNCLELVLARCMVCEAIVHVSHNEANQAICAVCGWPIQKPCEACGMHVAAHNAVIIYDEDHCRDCVPSSFHTCAKWQTCETILNAKTYCKACAERINEPQLAQASV